MFKKREISIDGKKYPIKLTLAAWVKVCEKYESPQGMIDAFQADKTKALLEG